MRNKNILALAITACGTGFSILSSILMARILHPTNYGMYVYLISIASILSILMQMGLPNHSTATLGKIWGKVKKTCLIKYLIFVAKYPIILAAIYYSLGYILISKALIAINFNYALICILGLTMATLSIATGIFRGINLSIFALIPDGLLRPSLLFTALLLIYINKIDPTTLEAIGITLSITVISAFSAIVIIIKRINECNGMSEFFISDRSWIKETLPYWGITLVGSISDHFSIVLIKLLTNEESAAFYRISLQGGGLISLIILTLSSIKLGEISKLFSENKIFEIKKISNNIIKSSLIYSLPIVIVFSIFGDKFIYYTFGSSYSSASLILAVIAIGRYIQLLLGIPGQILLMTGSARITFMSWTTTSILSFIAGCMLIEYFGYIAMAFAMLLGDIFNNLFLRSALNKKIKNSGVVF